MPRKSASKNNGGSKKTAKKRKSEETSENDHSETEIYQKDYLALVGAFAEDVDSLPAVHPFHDLTFRKKEQKRLETLYATNKAKLEGKNFQVKSKVKLAHQWQKDVKSLEAELGRAKAQEEENPLDTDNFLVIDDLNAKVKSRRASLKAMDNEIQEALSEVRPFATNKYCMIVCVCVEG